MSENVEIKNYLLPKKNSNKKTLVLDLDETLVHSQFEPFDRPSDITLRLCLDNEIHDIFILVRPGVDQFLENMGKFFEIVIFTASVSSYADPVLDIIDPRKICKNRLFREHCTQINDIFVKDLKKLGRDLKDIIIVDNSPMSYYLDHENGLPITSWFEDPNDRELFNISGILEFLCHVPDVRSYIKKIVVNDTIYYQNVIDIFYKYNELMAKNQKKTNSSKIKKYSKKINSNTKYNTYILTENRENISNNIPIPNTREKNKKNVMCENNKIIRNNSKKNNKQKQIIYSSNFPINEENKENINPNLFDIKKIYNLSIPDIIQVNKTTKNRNMLNINYNSYPILSDTSNSYVNLISKNNNKNSTSKNKNINLKSNVIIRHKKSASINLSNKTKTSNALKTIRKIYENKFRNNSKNNNLQKTNISNNIILRQKKKIGNNISREKTFQNNIHFPKNKSYKGGIQLSLRMNSELNYELNKLDESDFNNRKLSKSIKKEKLSKIINFKNNFCNKSVILNVSKPNNKKFIHHKKNHSINNSYTPLSLKLNKEEINSFFTKRFKDKRYLSTSESYNNNCSYIHTLSNVHRNNNSFKKTNSLNNRNILKYNTNRSFLKKKENKIPFNIKTKKNSGNENSLKNRIPINKKILMNNNFSKNNRYNKVENILNTEYQEPMTTRQKSSKQIIFRKYNTKYCNKSYKEKERKNFFNEMSEKCNIENILNNIIYVNNIIKRNDIFVTKSFKLNK